MIVHETSGFHGPGGFAGRTGPAKRKLPGKVAALPTPAATVFLGPDSARGTLFSPAGALPRKMMLARLCEVL